MQYVEYRDQIQRKLRRKTAGLTWKQLRDELDLPYDRPCPNWTKRLEDEIGLTRTKGQGRALVWRVSVARNGA
jgi:hypothetical protein